MMKKDETNQETRDTRQETKRTERPRSVSVSCSSFFFVVLREEKNRDPKAEELFGMEETSREKRRSIKQKRAFDSLWQIITPKEKEPLKKERKKMTC